MVITLDKHNFDEVVASNDLTVVDFWAKWCGPCQNFAKTFQAAAKKMRKISFASINIDEQQELAADFNVRSVPFLMIFRKNIAVFAEAGAISAFELENLISQAENLDLTAVQQQIEIEEKK